MTNHQQPLPRLLTPRQVCEAYQVSVSTLVRLRKQGLPTILFGSRPRFDEEEVKRWLLGRPPTQGGDA